MKKILFIITLVCLSFSQSEGNTTLKYTYSADLTEDDITSIHFLASGEKKIFDIDVDEKNKRLVIETRGSVEPKVISMILSKSGFEFTLQTKNLAKTTSSEEQSKIR